MSKNTNLSFLTDYITADITNGRIGINNASPSYSFDVNGTMRTSGATYLATASGNVGIGTTSATTAKLVVTGGVSNSIATIAASFGTSNAINIGDDGTNAVLGVGNSSTDMLFLKRVAGVYSEAMRITSAGNVGIGTSAPGYKLEVSGTGYFSGALNSGGSISAAGTLSSANLSTSQVLYATNLTTFNYAYSVAVTVPNALNSGSTTAEIRMYMIWATGFGDAVHGGGRIWLMIMNGNGTDYSSVELLGRDTAGGSGLSISRSSENQITVASNGFGYIKSISCMQLITN